MGQPQPETPVEEVLDKILGYLNFSSGQHDPKFFSNLDFVFRHCDATPPQKESPSTTDGRPSRDNALVDRVASLLRKRLDHLKKSSDTFHDSVQAENILNLVFEDFLPAWLLHHRDLFYHQSRNSLFNSFLTARVIETIAAQASQSDSPNQIISNSIAFLNDHIGHRPVATLTSQKIEPYANEWVRPIPIYIKDAGICLGKYETLAKNWRLTRAHSISITPSTNVPTIISALGTNTSWTIAATTRDSSSTKSHWIRCCSGLSNFPKTTITTKTNLCTRRLPPSPVRC